MPARRLCFVASARLLGWNKNQCVRTVLEMSPGKGAKDGEKFVEVDLDLELSALEKIRLVQSSDPQVELFTSGDSEESTATIEFACDTGSTLFRNALRQAIWGLGSFRSLLSRWDR